MEVAAVVRKLKFLRHSGGGAVYKTSGTLADRMIRKVRGHAFFLSPGAKEGVL